MEKKVFCYFAPKWLNYTPIDIGYVLATIKQGKHCSNDMELVRLDHFNPDIDIDPISREVGHIVSCDPKVVIFFVESVFWSRVFSWNRAKILSMELKKVMPSITIGVQSYKAPKSLVEDPSNKNVFDFVLEGDAESSLSHLDAILEKKDVPGVFYPGNSSSVSKDFFIKPETKKNVRNLDSIPSPYLTGVLDNFLEERQTMHLGGFQPFVYSSKGCAFGCYYCWRSVKSERRVDLFSKERFYDEIEYMHKKFSINIFFVIDDAFPLSIKRLSGFYDEFEKRKKMTPTLGNIRLHSMCRAEGFDPEVAELLQKINMNWVQIGLQTASPDLQHYMNRKMDVGKFKDISMWLRERKIDLCLDIVIGLPNDSVDMVKKTLDFAVSLSPQSIRINRFFLNPNTLFFQQREKYGIRVENEDGYFSVPFVKEAFGIDDRYFREAKKYIVKMKVKNQNIKWLDFLQLS